MNQYIVRYGVVDTLSIYTYFYSTNNLYFVYNWLVTIYFMYHIIYFGIPIIITNKCYAVCIDKNILLIPISNTSTYLTDAYLNKYKMWK